MNRQMLATMKIGEQVDPASSESFVETRKTTSQNVMSTSSEQLNLNQKQEWLADNYSSSDCTLIGSALSQKSVKSSPGYKLTVE